ncbi:hypothetical protein PIB30_076453 [Stylosanthes scabra]|uniref:Uncharacterized protein n=1 Tax=Stylosanthes scabra TaxID=79078 RepID=A0ABU6XN90_9FABA|nr:hypothetical protein [Stylosanthes scabra]
MQRQHPMYLDPHAEPYLARAGLLPLARLCDTWFKLTSWGYRSMENLLLDSYMSLIRGCLRGGGNAVRRRMVGTRTTSRDWQWLDEMMGEEVEQEAGPRQLSLRVVQAADGLIRQGLVRRGDTSLSTILTAALPYSDHHPMIFWSGSTA